MGLGHGFEGFIQVAATQCRKTECSATSACSVSLVLHICTAVHLHYLHVLSLPFFSQDTLLVPYLSLLSLFPLPISSSVSL